MAEILVGETLQQPHQVVDLLDHEAGAGEQQHHEDDPMSAVSTSPVQSRRSAMVLAMAASMPSLSRVASRLLASNQSLASSSRVLNTMSSTTLGTSRMLLMRLSSGFNCIIFLLSTSIIPLPS